MNHYLSTDPADCKSRVEFSMAFSLGTNGVIVITPSSPHPLVSYISDEFFKYNIQLVGILKPCLTILYFKKNSLIYFIYHDYSYTWIHFNHIVLFSTFCVLFVLPPILLANLFI